MKRRRGMCPVLLIALAGWQCRPADLPFETTHDEARTDPTVPIDPIDPSQPIGGPRAPTLAQRVLVLFNENHPDGLRLATYYATKRKIPAANLCGVRLTPGGIGSAHELMAARDTIVEDCICPNLPTVPSCGVANIKDVVNASPYTHLAIMRGMPQRLTGHEWLSHVDCPTAEPCPNNKKPSFDYYLSYLIYRDETIFGPDLFGNVAPEYSHRGAETHFKRALRGTDRMLAYSRVEAITTERTFALIDRTIESERVGLSGNFFSESAVQTLRDLVDANEPICSDYLTHEPFVFGSPDSSWDPVCRYASTDVTSPGSVHEQIPGENGSPIPMAIDAQILAGNSFTHNGMTGFDGFSNMLNWRRSDVPCEPLCGNLPTAEERTACENNSTDYFRELNTDCVGAALGFMGHQYRSYPVQYYGFYPEGWFVRGPGATEKTPPQMVTGGGFTSDRFTDENYAHFGTRTVANSAAPMPCEWTSHQADCRERIAANLLRRIDVPAAIQPVPTLALRLVARYRTDTNPGARLHFTVQNAAKTETVYRVVPMVGDTTEWQRAETTLTLQDGATPSLNVAVFTVLADNVRDYLDIDAIEVIHIPTDTQLLDAEAGGFASIRHHQTHQGDWASTVIDRLGGVAWWGSSSHHLYGGHTLSRSNDIFAALYRGRTFGEAIMDKTAAAGLIFGDPMYRPATADVHFGPDFASRPANPDDIVRVYLDTVDIVPIRVSAKNGQATSWRIEFCESHDRTLCAGNWTMIESGVGAIDNRHLSWSQLPNDHTYDGTLRVAVWNPTTIDRPLYGNAYFRFSNENYGGVCIGDFDDDGDVDANDRALYASPCPPSIAFYDLDSDEVFTIFDIIDIGFLPDGDPRRDPDGDGVEYTDADQLLMVDWLCWTPYSRFDDLDLDGDGDVDEIDEARFESRVGTCY